MLGRIRNLPLRYALALAMSGLTALVVVLTVLLASHEVRRSTRVAADERLSRVVAQLATMAAASAEQRRQDLVTAGGDPILAGRLLGQPVEDERVAAALASLRAPSDSGLPVQLWDLAGGPVFSDLADPTRTEIRYAPLVPLDTVPAYGAFHERQGEVFYYSTTPVLDGGTAVGWVVQRRRIGNPRVAMELQRLIGRQSRVVFFYPGDSLWVTLAGEAVAAPVRRAPPDSTIVFDDPDHGRVLARAEAVAGTPWSVLVEMPMAMLEAGAQAFVRRMAAVGIVLVLVAMALAWILSRRLTRPLGELAVASGALAAGDYATRVTPRRGGDEVTRVAAAFNAMAEQVAESHRALERRLDDARQLAGELESADQAKSEFLATISHEIRTPINAVLGLCDVMELEGISDEQRQDYLRRTRRAARQLAVLVSDVLDLAKVESGGIEIRPEPASAGAAVEHAVGLLREESRRKAVAVEVDADADAVYYGDPVRVEQILLNLVGNAVKFTPERGRVHIRAGRTNGSEPATLPPREAGWIRFEVEDTGIGLERTELERIFEPFVQGQSGYTREYGGTGLGLSISRRLARLMGGEILAESRPGSGARFTLLLPATVAVIAEA